MDILIIIGLFVFALMFWRGFLLVKPNHQAILKRSGKYFKVLESGVQLYMPFYMSVEYFSWKNASMRLNSYQVPKKQLCYNTETIVSSLKSGTQLKIQAFVEFQITKLMVATAFSTNLYQSLEEMVIQFIQMRAQESDDPSQLKAHFCRGELEKLLSQCGITVNRCGILNCIVLENSVKPEQDTKMQLQQLIEFAKTAQTILGCTPAELAGILQSLGPLINSLKQ